MDGHGSNTVAISVSEVCMKVIISVRELPLKEDSHAKRMS